MLGTLIVGGRSIRRPDLSSYRLEYWMNRVSLVNTVFERATARGELPETMDTTLFVELLAGPVYVRTLLTGRALDQTSIERIVDVVLAGSATPTSTAG